MSWDACTSEPNAMLRWLECHPGAADWAAAVFGGLAVLVAVSGAVIAWVIENRRVKARGRVIAFRLNAPIIGIWAEATHGLGLIPGLIEKAKDPVWSPPFLVEKYLGINARIPPDVFSETWTLPERIALGVAQLDTHLSRQSLWLDNLDGALMAANPEQRAALLRMVEGQLNNIAELSEEIKNFVGSIGDAVVAKNR